MEEKKLHFCRLKNIPCKTCTCAESIFSARNDRILDCRRRTRPHLCPSFSMICPQKALGKRELYELKPTVNMNYLFVFETVLTVSKSGRPGFNLNMKSSSLDSICPFLSKSGLSRGLISCTTLAEVMYKCMPMNRSDFELICCNSS